jgi:ribosome-associated protein
MLAKRIASLTLSKKATDVVIMDLRRVTSMTDYFVICSGDSDTQVKAIADGVEEGMEKQSVRPWHKERGSINWILLDYVDVVLHVFHKNTRSFYNLEKLWGDAEFTRLDDSPPLKAKRPVHARKVSTRSPRRKVAS